MQISLSLQPYKKTGTIAAYGTGLISFLPNV